MSRDPLRSSQRALPHHPNVSRRRERCRDAEHEEWNRRETSPLPSVRSRLSTDREIDSGYADQYERDEEIDPSKTRGGRPNSRER